MKLSLAWIFDHIDADWHSIDVAELVAKFNEMTAEIEGFKKVEVDLDSLSFARVTLADGDTTKVHSDEWDAHYTLPTRSDTQKDAIFLIKKDGDDVRWATSINLGGDKEMIIPRLSCDDKHFAGKWKKHFETKDYILDLDNKSVTNRPDMWGHRGVAREVAAILNVPFKPLVDFITHTEIKNYPLSGVSQKDYPFAIKVENDKACRRFAGLFVEHIENRPALLWMTSRLSRVDSRSIDAVVDMTNYVMLDISQPMHAFDAQEIPTKKVVIRNAQNKEKLTLLDGQKIELSSDDLVVTDGEKPLALAGIMGGSNSGINPETTSLFIESACFNAQTVRRTSARFKVRTEASARFEKSLDPNQNVTGIRRFLKLITDADIPLQITHDIISLGKRAEPKEITIKHSFIENQIGTTVAFDFVCTTFEKLGFGVKKEGKGTDLTYKVEVPPFRSTKDITIKEDLVEEVVRFFGYANIPYVLPTRQMATFDISDVMRVRTIKQLMASALAMRELQQYAFFDESFLRSINWDPGKTLEVKSPVSENWRRLVTSLIPNLFKAVRDHSGEYNYVRFFEWGRIWKKDPQVQEKKALSGIVFDQKNTVDFYDAKANLTTLFDGLKLNVEWQKVDGPLAPWFNSNKTACIVHNGKNIGTAGNVNHSFFESVAQGDAFIFELDGDYLLNYRHPVPVYKPASKYPSIDRDISMLVPLELTVAQVSDVIAEIDNRISSVRLVDFFQKKEWEDKKSLTIRFVITDSNKTLTKEEADVIWEKAVDRLQNLGAIIR